MVEIPAEPDWWRARDRDGALWLREPTDDGNVWRVSGGHAEWLWAELWTSWGPIVCADDEAVSPAADGPCDRTDLPEQSDMRCPCGFEAGEHLAWRRRYCRNRRYPEHGRHSPCALCGYEWTVADA